MLGYVQMLLYWKKENDSRMPFVFYIINRDLIEKKTIFLFKIFKYIFIKILLNCLATKKKRIRTVISNHI